MKDPLTTWDGTFPYDVFAEFGITPGSTHAEVQAASFALLRKNQLTQEAQVAWDELRLLDRRLFVDLFVYPDVATGGATDSATDSGGERGER